MQRQFQFGAPWPVSWSSPDQPPWLAAVRHFNSAMKHVTLNTGHAVDQADSNPGVAKMMAPLLEGGSLGLVASELSTFRVVVAHGDGRAVFTVFRGSDPIISAMVCLSEDSAAAAWAEIETLYLSVSDANPALVAATALPEMPEKTPWLATVILPALVVQPGDTAYWLGDFERCMAWTLLGGVDL